MKLFYIPLIALQLVPPLSVFVIFTAYQKSAVLLLALLTIIINLIVLYFTFYKKKEQINKLFSYQGTLSKKDFEELMQKRDSESRDVFIGAVMRYVPWKPLK